MLVLFLYLCNLNENVYIASNIYIYIYTLRKNSETGHIGL